MKLSCVTFCLLLLAAATSAFAQHAVYRPIFSVGDPAGEFAQQFPAELRDRPDVRRPRWRIPGEFERLDGLLLAANELATHYPQLFLQLVSAASHRLQVYVLVDSSEDRQLIADILDRGRVPDSAVRFIHASHDTMWLRDYGPIFVLDERRVRSIIDADYAQVGRGNDDRVPLALSAPLRSTVTRVPLNVEGGNLLSNGQGLVLTTEAMLELNIAEGRRPYDVERVLRDYLGAEEVVVLERLEGESTGHVDMFATFTSPLTAVVGAYPYAIDPVNAAILDRNAERLSQIVTSSGPMRVVRIPMPPHDDGRWRTFTNAVFLNGTLAVPAYPDVPLHLHERALSTYRHLLPDWEVVQVDVSSIIELGGALHCICMQIPAGPVAATYRNPLAVRRPRG